MQKNKIKGERKAQLFLITIAIFIKKDLLYRVSEFGIFAGQKITIRKPVKIIPDCRGN